MKPIVVIESPFAGNVQRNLCYARAAMRDSLLRGESPFVSHVLYTQEGVLDDNIRDERNLGIEAGFVFRTVAKKTVVYDDLGISPGMKLGIEHSNKLGVPVEYRSLPRWNKERTVLNPDE